MDEIEKPVHRINHLFNLLSQALLFFTEYQTPKIVQVKNKKIAILNRCIQLSIILYIIGYVIIYNKGYQDFSNIQSVIITKLKGTTYGNVTQNNQNTMFNNSLSKYYNRIWDNLDIVHPPQDNDGFFVTTNVIITPDQELGTCPENPSELTFCDIINNNCTKGHRTVSGAGIQTGRCVKSPIILDKYVCEISGWCPVEMDHLPLENQTAFLSETKHFTVMIKNYVNFDTFKIQKRNIENTLIDQTYLKICRFDAIKDPRCPIFVLKDIVGYAGENYDEMAKLGGVIAIKINWDCNLDVNSIDACFPKYSFERIDLKDALVSPGFNYRYARYKDYNKRTMYKVYGIKFVIMVTGRGGRFNIIPLLINIGSGVGLLTIATVICDIFMIYVSSGKEVYKDKKFQLVTDIRSVEEETV